MNKKDTAKILLIDLPMLLIFASIPFLIRYIFLHIAAGWVAGEYWFNPKAFENRYGKLKSGKTQD